MKYSHPNALLFIEPRFIPKKDIVIDELSIKMFNAINDIEPKKIDSIRTLMKIPNIGSIGFDKKKLVFNQGAITLGHHDCVCGATSTSYDYYIDDYYITNYLSVHYLVCHRPEVPKAELEKVQKLSSSSILKEEDKELFEKCYQNMKQ